MLPRRWGLRTMKSYGKSGDAGNTVIENALPTFHEKLEGFFVKNIFKADKSGLVYKMAPGTTRPIECLLERKNQ